ERDGAAVGDRDDALALADPVAVHLRYDQRHVLLHPPGAALVDHQRARLDGRRRELERLRAADREEGDVDPTEGALGELLDLDSAAVVGQPGAGRAAGGEGAKASDREL